MKVKTFALLGIIAAISMICDKDDSQFINHTNTLEESKSSIDLGDITIKPPKPANTSEESKRGIDLGDITIKPPKPTK